MAKIIILLLPVIALFVWTVAAQQNSQPDYGDVSDQDAKEESAVDVTFDSSNTERSKPVSASSDPRRPVNENNKQLHEFDDDEDNDFEDNTGTESEDGEPENYEDLDTEPGGLSRSGKIALGVTLGLVILSVIIVAIVVCCMKGNGCRTGQTEANVELQEVEPQLEDLATKESKSVRALAVVNQVASVFKLGKQSSKNVHVDAEEDQARPSNSAEMVPLMAPVPPISTTPKAFRMPSSPPMPPSSSPPHTPTSSFAPGPNTLVRSKWFQMHPPKVSTSAPVAPIPTVSALPPMPTESFGPPVAPLPSFVPELPTPPTPPLSNTPRVSSSPPVAILPPLAPVPTMLPTPPLSYTPQVSSSPPVAPLPSFVPELPTPPTPPLSYTPQVSASPPVAILPQLAPVPTPPPTPPLSYTPQVSASPPVAPPPSIVPEEPMLPIPVPQSPQTPTVSSTPPASPVLPRAPTPPNA